MRESFALVKECLRTLVLTGYFSHSRQRFGSEERGTSTNKWVRQYICNKLRYNRILWVEHFTNARIQGTNGM